MQKDRLTVHLSEPSGRGKDTGFFRPENTVIFLASSDSRRKQELEKWARRYHFAGVKIVDVGDAEPEKTTLGKAVGKATRGLQVITAGGFMERSGRNVIVVAADARSGPKGRTDKPRNGDDMREHHDSWSKLRLDGRTAVNVSGYVALTLARGKLVVARRTDRVEITPPSAQVLNRAIHPDEFGGKRVAFSLRTSPPIESRQIQVVSHGRTLHPDVGVVRAKGADPGLFGQVITEVMQKSRSR